MNTLEVRSRFTEYRVWLCAVLKVKFKEFTVFIFKKKKKKNEFSSFAYSLIAIFQNS